MLYKSKKAAGFLKKTTRRLFFYKQISKTLNII